jgi:hypothetical protein
LLREFSRSLPTGAVVAIKCISRATAHYTSYVKGTASAAPLTRERTRL